MSVGRAIVRLGAFLLYIDKWIRSMSPSPLCWWWPSKWRTLFNVCTGKVFCLQATGIAVSLILAKMSGCCGFKLVAMVLFHCYFPCCISYPTTELTWSKAKEYFPEPPPRLLITALPQGIDRLSPQWTLKITFRYSSALKWTTDFLIVISLQVNHMLLCLYMSPKQLLTL